MSKLLSFYRHNRVLMIITLLGLINYAIKFSLNAFLIHHLGEALYGDFSLGFRMLLILSGVILMGSGITSKRYLQQYLVERDTTLLTQYLNWNLTLVKRMSFLCLGVFALLTLILFLLHFTQLHSLFEYHFIMYFTWFSPLAAIAGLLASYFGASQQIIKSIIFRDLLSYFFMFILFFACVYLLDWKLHSIVIINVIFFTYTLVIIIEMGIMKQSLPKLYQQLPKGQAQDSPSHKKEWSQLSRRLFMSSIFLQIADVVAMLILEFFAPNEADLGLFSAIIVLYGLFWAINLSIGHFFVPKIAPLVRENKIPTLIDLYRRVFRLKLWMMLPALILFIGFIHPILGLFSPKLQAVWHYPIILAIASTFSCLLSPTKFIANLTGQALLNLRLNQAEILILLLIGIPAVYFYGLGGMVWVYTFNIVSKSLIVGIRINQAFRFSPFWPF